MPDYATLIGLVGSFAIVGMAIMQGEGGLMLFINVPSLLIVIVGSIFVALMKFGLKQFLGAIGVALKAFFFKLEQPTDLIEQAVNLANKARKEGIISLEEETITNGFLQKGVEFLVDNVDGKVIKTTLYKEMNQAMERHDGGIKIFKAIGDVGPAMGMIGTLVGLVQMLAAMDDPKTIGPAMAVALLTTLYGAILGNMFALPIADKLTLRNQEERIVKLLLIDTILAIQAELHPRVLEESLQPYLAESKRKKEEEK
ncbi:MAG: flagellar motor protein PomA [Myxococcota bacterium]|nr:flagellar motor protein PomA [Myxococcota bacterium]